MSLPSTPPTPPSGGRAEALLAFGAELAATRLDRVDLVNVAARLVSEALGGSAALFLLSPDGQWLNPEGVSHPDPQVVKFIRKMFASEPHSVNEGLLGLIATTAEPLHLREVPEALLRSAYPSANRHEYFDSIGVYSLVGVPVRALGVTYGVLVAASDDPARLYETGDVRFASDLAERVGLALSHEHLLHEANQATGRLAAILASAADAIITVHANGTIESVNPAGETMFGWTASELVGQPISVLSHCDPTHELPVRLDEVLTAPTDDHEPGRRQIVSARRRNGTVFPGELSVSHMTATGDRLTVGIVRDVTAEHELRKQLGVLASTDPVTGMPNRHSFIAHLQRILDQGEPITLLFVDVDDFKSVNDQGGHRFGDSVLMYTADRIRSCLTDIDIASRWGGDEFLIACPGGGLEAMNLAERLAAQFSMPFQIPGHEPVWLSVSVGVAASGDGTVTVDELVQRSDAAMYHAKHGGGSVTLWHEGIVHPDDARHRGHKSIAAALDDDQFELWYQPVADTNRNIHGHEALIRWRTPDGEIVPPDMFIPLAEETRLIHRVGRFVMRTAFQYATLHPEVGVIAINVSRVQLTTGGVSADVFHELETSGLDPHRLCIEITESSAVHIPAASIQELQDLRNAGVRIAIDDFGTGVSTLTSLFDLPIDIVKLDRAFTRRLPGDQALIRGSIDLIHALDLTVTAEGVETLEQMEVLQELGCDHFQGWHIGRPVPEPV